MSGELVYLLEASPLDSTGAAATVCFSSGLYNEAELLNGNKYPVRLSQAYTHETSIFEENQPGQTNISLGSSTINNVDGRFDYLLDYAWDARAVVIKRGLQGAAYSSYVTEFVGSTTEITADNSNLVLTLRDNSYKLAKPLQPNKYLGTTGAEGGADLQNKAKPLLFGKTRNLTPVVVDSVLLTYQIHDGAIASVDAVYDRGNKLTFYKDYGSYALLVAATIPPGFYATSLATGFIRTGAPTAGVLTLDAVGAFGTVTNIPELVKQLLTTRLGLASGELDTAAFTQASTDAPWAFEGIYFQEPDLQYDELIETLTSSVNGFWFVTRLGLISFKIFKFTTPTVSIRQEDLVSLGKAPSPKPLFRVKVNYAKNATVQPASDFPVPRNLLNAYLDKEYHFVDITGTPDYSGAGKLNVFLNSTPVNDLDIALFSIPNDETWIAIDSVGNITVTSSGVASATAIVRVNIGEYAWDEPFTLIRDSVAPLQKIDLSFSADRFIYNDLGKPTPTSQTITITATGTNTTAPITLTAVDNLGNNVALSGNTIPIANISPSAMVEWVAVTAKDANNVTQKKRFIIQRGLNAAASGINSTTGANWQTNVTNKPPTLLVMASFNYNNDLQFTRDWNLLGGANVERLLDQTDTSVPGGVYARFGNNSGDDQVILDYKGGLTTFRGGDVSYDPNGLYEVSFFVRRISGTGTVFLGLEGIASDGVTRVNTVGADSFGSQHYVAANGASPSSSWTFYRGYMKGKSATPDGVVHNDPASPGTMHTNTAYIRPILYVNYPNAAGQTDVAYARIRRIDAAQIGSSLLDQGGSTVFDVGVKNSAVSINADGTLVGAGGGKVGLTALGYTGGLALIGANNTLDGNSLSKTGGTSGTYEGAALGRPLADSAYISCTPSQVAGRYTLLALDDDTTTYDRATQTWCLQLIYDGGSGHNIYLFNNGVNAAGPVTFGTGTTVGTVSLTYDGATVRCFADGVEKLSYSTGVVARQTYIPKVLTWQTGATYANILYSHRAVRPRSGSTLEDSSGSSLSDTAIKNSAVSITSGGALVGAGGGTATIPGMGGGSLAFGNSIGGNNWQRDASFETGVPTVTNKSDGGGVVLSSLSSSPFHGTYSLGLASNGGHSWAFSTMGNGESATFVAIDTTAILSAHVRDAGVTNASRGGSGAGPTSVMLTTRIGLYNVTTSTWPTFTSANDITPTFGDTSWRRKKITVTGLTVGQTYALCFSTDGNVGGEAVDIDAVQIEFSDTISAFTAVAPEATVGATAGTDLRDSSRAILTDSGVKNSAISITSGGSLNGAGGGTVTYSGLGGGAVGLEADLRLGGSFLKDSSGVVLTNASVKNSAVSLTGAGALSGAGGGSVDYDLLPNGGTYAKVKSTELTAGVLKLKTSTSGYQLGGATNVPAILSAGTRYYINQNPTYGSTTSTTSVISMPAFTLTLGGDTISYNANTKSVTGSGTQTFYIYGDDPGMNGGTYTLNATTSTTVPYQGTDRIFIGTVTITFTSGGTGGGTGGGGGDLTCVSSDSWVETSEGFVLARDVKPGMSLAVLSEDMQGYDWAVCEKNELGEELGWEIVSAISKFRLLVSDSAPLVLEDGTVIPPSKLGGQRLSLKSDDEVWWEPCYAYRMIGYLEVSHIHCGGHVYAAGVEKNKSILTHNPKP